MYWYFYYKFFNRDDGVVFDVHLLPSGMVVDGVNCLIGNGAGKDYLWIKSIYLFHILIL